MIRRMACDCATSPNLPLDKGRDSIQQAGDWFYYYAMVFEID